MPSDDSEALVLIGAWDPPPGRTGGAEEENCANIWRLDSFISAVARTVIASMAFLFKRPIRIFRPVRCA